MDIFCSNCGEKIIADDKYCRKCGAKNNVLSTGLSLRKKVSIFLFSILFAPLGLYWFFKLYKNENPEIKKIGYTALYITVIMIVVLVVVNAYYVTLLKEYINRYTNSMYGFY